MCRQEREAEIERDGVMWNVKQKLLRIPIKLEEIFEAEVNC